MAARTLSTLVLCALLSAALPAAAQQQTRYPLSVVDDQGNTVVIPALPRRIISLTLPTDEMLLSLVDKSRLLGVTIVLRGPRRLQRRRPGHRHPQQADAESGDHHLPRAGPRLCRQLERQRGGEAAAGRRHSPLPHGKRAHRFGNREEDRNGRPDRRDSGEGESARGHHGGAAGGGGGQGVEDPAGEAGACDRLCHLGVGAGPGQLVG